MLSREQRHIAAEARGFMPEEEGLALYDAANRVAVEGPLLEIGSYCGKSALYLGFAAAARRRTLFCVDHHRGSEENQPGWFHHEADLVDPEISKIDTLPYFRRTIHDAGLEHCVIAVVGESTRVAQYWNEPLALVFIDGGHGVKPAHADYEVWTPKLAVGATLLIHDVFDDPRDGGRPPYEIYRRALESGSFKEVSATGSLRELKKI